MNEICERVREEAALLGRAPDELREHSASCPECSEFLKKLAALESELLGLRSRDASDELVAKTLARTGASPRPSFHWRPWAMAAASAAGIALVLRMGLLDRAPGIEALKEAPATVERDDFAAPRTAPSETPPAEERQQLDSLGYVAEGIPDIRPEEQKLEGADDKAFAQRKLQMKEGFGGLPEPPVSDERGDIARARPADSRDDAPGKKDSDVLGGRIGSGSGAFLYDEGVLAKRSHRDPVYPEAAKTARVQGTVILEITVDREGDVVAVRVVRSIPLLDQAAIDAVRDWKYAPSDTDAPRVFPVAVPFTLEEPKEDEDRSRVEGLTFQEAKGYWANTYLPGDLMVRRLEAALRGASYPALHEAALPAVLPLDATATGALSVFVHADRRNIAEKSRLLVQVGIRASDRHGRRRPPMNVGVVLDLPGSVTPEVASATTALLESLESSSEIGDRFRLVVTGSGELLAPETFRHGPLTVALQDLYSRTPSGSACEALALALEKVHAGDEPTMPLGTSVVVVVTGRKLGADLEAMARMARRSALGGVAVSVVGIGGGFDSAELDRLALEGQGRRYTLDGASEARGLIDRELSSASRTVARAIRLRIQLAEGVHLVDVLGSEPLTARESERVRAEERSIDLRLARNLGIEADRGKDEDGIQIVIPAFYASDAHSILLDVVAEGPGPIAEVTARYKDLVRLENTVASASLALTRRETAPGPLETSVDNDHRELLVALALRSAAEALERGETGTASLRLQNAMAFARERDRSMLQEYLRFLPQLPSSYLRDSLLYASALKRTHTASPTGPIG